MERIIPVLFILKIVISIQCYQHCISYYNQPRVFYEKLGKPIIMQCVTEINEVTSVVEYFLSEIVRWRYFNIILSPKPTYCQSIL